MGVNKGEMGKAIEPREMGQKVRVLAALPEELSSVPSSHTVEGED